MSPLQTIGLIIGIIVAIIVIIFAILFAISPCTMKKVNEASSPVKYFFYCLISPLIWT
jgi:hypothetical protein